MPTLTRAPRTASPSTAVHSTQTNAAETSRSSSAQTPKFMREPTKASRIGLGIFGSVVKLVELTSIPLTLFMIASEFGAGDKVNRAMDKSPTVLKKAGHVVNAINTTSVADIAPNRAAGMGRFGNVPLANFVMAASSALGVFWLSRGMKDKVDMVRQMEFELTGKMPSRMQVAKGDIDPILKPARDEALGWFNVGATMFEGGMAVYFMKQSLFRGHAGTNNMLGRIMDGKGGTAKTIGMSAANAGIFFMLPKMIQEGRDSRTILQGYMMAHQCQQAGQPIPKEAYLAMLKGLMPGASLDKLYMDAEQCAELQVPLATTPERKGFFESLSNGFQETKQEETATHPEKKAADGVQASAATQTSSEQEKPHGRWGFLHSKVAMGTAAVMTAASIGSFALLHGKKDGQASAQGGMQAMFQKVREFSGGIHR